MNESLAEYIANRCEEDWVGAVKEFGLKRIGEGGSRTVYRSSVHPSVVVKREFGNWRDNAKEWKTYNSCIDHTRRFLAKAWGISGGSRVLVQERVRRNYPRYGLVDDEPMLHDDHEDNVFYCPRRKHNVIVDYADGFHTD